MGVYGPIGVLMNSLCHTFVAENTATGRPIGRPTLSRPHRCCCCGKDRIRAIDWFAVFLVQRHLNMRHVSGTKDAKGTNRQIANRSVLGNRQTLACYPTECHMNRTDCIGAKNDRVEQTTTAKIDTNATIETNRNGGDCTLCTCH